MEQNYKVTSIDRETYCIEEDGGIVYGYLLLGSSRAALIDTGVGLLDYKAVTEQLTDLPVDVINTHGHLDHISCNARFHTAYLHPEDEAVYLDHSSYDTRYQYVTNTLREAGIPESQWGLSPIRERIEKQCCMPAADNRRPIRDGDVLNLGGRELEVIHTPGHTPGSVCILDRSRRSLFSGDTVCDLGILLNLDHCCSVETFARSIEVLKARADEYDRIWPAHHKKPIGKDYLQDYELCARQILEAGKNTAADDAQIKAAAFGQVQIAYTTDNVWDRTGCES